MKKISNSGFNHGLTVIAVSLLTVLTVLSSCKKKEPYDLQSPDDNPRILIPYEGDEGPAVNRGVTNPDAYYDSVVVVPTAFTTVNWYLDKVLVHTGFKINKTFPTGTYNLLIEAVTTAGKKTSRSGKLVVSAAASDPYVAAPTSGRHLAANKTVTVEGRNLAQVKKLVLTRDLFAKDEVCNLVPSAVSDGSITFTLPEMADGNYYFRLQDGEGNVYGSDIVSVHHDALILSKFDSFTPGQTWKIQGINLQDVASLTLGEVTITALTVTETEIKLTAPNVEEGSYNLSVLDKNGTPVSFATSAGLVQQVSARALSAEEKTLWEGSKVLKWDENNIKLTKNDMAAVPMGSTINIEFSILPSGDPEYYDPEKGGLNEYQALRIITPGWNAADDILAQQDMGGASSPFSFTYDEQRKGLVESKESMSLVGWGLTITRITYK